MLFPQNNSFLCGRGATAIYLVLQALKNQDNRRRVIVPANICYAAVYPILYAGFSPVFCDVCSEDGNASLNCIRARMDSSIGGLLIPHMYGNPVQEIAEIKSFCHHNRLFLIEDCASAMGASLPDGTKVGTFGDYTIYSTGYAKTVDLGIGGVIASNNRLNAFEKLEEELPEYTSGNHEAERFFSRQYRQWRNSNRKLKGSEWETFFLHSDFRHLFLFKIDCEMKKRIRDRLERDLDIEIRRRRNNHDIYCQYLQGVPSIQLYHYNKGAVPWRFSIIVPAPKRRQIIDSLLEKKIPVSDWYPPVVQLFDNSDSYPGAQRSGDSILNFPLTISEAEITSICAGLIEVLRKVL